MCKTVLVAQKVIPAAGHKWSEYRESGKVKRKCSVCGKTETVRTLPKVKMVQLSKTSYTYDGKSHMPAVKVTNSAGKKLKEGTDYKIKKPSGRKNAGIYTVTIEMKGDYTGKYQKTFQIIPKWNRHFQCKGKEKSIFGVLEEAGKTDKRLPDPICSGCEIQKVGCDKECQ